MSLRKESSEQGTSSQNPFKDSSFAIYVHWPFCAAKCPYCDFNSHVRQNPVDQKRFSAALALELDKWSYEVGNRVVTSIFFGGGTPSLMLPESVESVLKTISKNWIMDDHVEITLEANPNSVEVSRFADYHSLGINRLSLGVQAFDDEALQALGRIHDHREALIALETTARIFDNYSFDMIYARPGQRPSMWKKELREALRYAREHISLYQLTIEEGTRFFRLWDTGQLQLPDEEDACRLYEITQEECEKQGLPAYEVSNHAKPGKESRHNLLYWRYGEYLGIGPGAHGRVITPEGRIATRTERNPEKWLQSIEMHSQALVEQNTLPLAMQAEEFLMMGLRLKEGISLKRLKDFSGFTPNPVIMNDLKGMDLLNLSGDRLAATKQGFLVLNTLIRKLCES